MFVYPGQTCETENLDKPKLVQFFQISEMYLYNGPLVVL